MRLSEYSKLDATALAALVSGGVVQPVELIALAREAYECTKSAGAVVEFFDDECVAAADGSAAGPFFGVPMMLKDLGATQRGRRSERGSRLYRGWVAAESSALTRKLVASGLVNVGRTASSELAIAATVETICHGTAHNPWDPSRTTAGSSGGAAAAVALGIVPVAHGTDSGGSLRMPAACCGVVGMKPSRGRISSAPAALLPGDLTVEFAITKSVRDTARLLDSICGSELGDPYEVPPPTSRFLAAVSRSPQPLRVALVTDHFWGREVDSECVAAASDAAELCAQLGHRVVPMAPKFPVQEWISAMIDVWSASVAHEVDGRGGNDELLEGLTRAWARRGRSLPATRLILAAETLDSISRLAAVAFADVDVVLSPTLPTLPPSLGIYDPHEAVPSEWYFDSPIGDLESFTSLFNVTGQPAMSLPLGHSASGLPIGIQLVGRMYREDDLFSLAAQLEHAAPWHTRLAPAHVSSII